MNPRCGGMTLVELLLAMGLGAVLMLGASSMLLAVSASHAAQASQARMDDSGRYAMDVVARALRQSAYINLDAGAGAWLPATEDSASLSGLDARSLVRNAEGISNSLPDAMHGSDVLAVRFQGAGPADGGDGTVLNCAGFAVGAGASESERGWSIFYVAIGGDGEAELRCKYRSANGWGADAIIRGVDSFQVLYGLDTDTPADGVANLYLNATGLDARDASLVPAGETATQRQRDLLRRTHWKRVTSVRLALLLHGEDDQGGQVAQTGPPQFDLFGPAYSDAHGAGDAGVRIVLPSLPAIEQRRLRKLVQTTVMLRNAVPRS